MGAPHGKALAGESPLVLVVEDDPDTRHFYALTLNVNQVLIKPFTAETLLAEARGLLRAAGEIPDRAIA